MCELYLSVEAGSGPISIEVIIASQSRCPRGRRLLRGRQTQNTSNGQAWQCSAERCSKFGSRVSLDSHLSFIDLWLLVVVVAVSECRKIRSGGLALPRFQARSP